MDCIPTAGTETVRGGIESWRYDVTDIGRAAVKAEDETAAIRVTYAFRSIIAHTAKLVAPAISTNTAPLSGVPLQHAFDCVRFARSRGLDKASCQSASILTDMICDVPKGIPFADVHAWLVYGLHEIAAAFHSDGRLALAEAVTRNQLLILSELSWEKTGFPEAVGDVLEKIALQVPVAMENERAAAPAEAYRSLKHAYDPTDVVSLAWLFGNALQWLYQADDGPAYRDQHVQGVDGRPVDHALEEFDDLDQAMPGVEKTIPKTSLRRPLSFRRRNRWMSSGAVKARTMHRWYDGVVAHGMGWAAAAVAVRVGSGVAVSAHVDVVGGMRCGLPARGIRSVSIAPTAGQGTGKRLGWNAWATESRGIGRTFAASWR